MYSLKEILVVAGALYLGQPSTEAQALPMIPARAVDIHNGTGNERVIVVRTASRREVLFRKSVSPAMPEPMFVRPEFWPCSTRLEASSDGKFFRPIRGDICQRSEMGDPMVLIISSKASPELVPVDPE